MSRAGRPKGYNKKIASKICEQIAQGMSLNRICKQDGFPSKVSVFRWLLDESLVEFRNQYAQARDMQAQGWSDDIIEIADDGENDTYIAMVDDEAVIKTNFDNIQRSKLRVDARKWVLSKLLPKKYGDKIEIPKEPEAEKPHEATKRIIISEPKPKRLTENE
jgi:hypothetical protein